ncbi:transcription factor ORG3-like [Bidens hawaiensis]|uniref:transcription factor ORG3-like n=1 Tax=Bidens hawaiensis TaxID=980011 RepID=UPI0040490A8A
MLAISPPLFSTTHGWALEDLITQNLPQDCHEANSYNHVLDFQTYDQFKYNLAPEHSFSSGETANGGTGDDEMMVVKKLNHNASERDRRKRVNELYAFLRSLLPVSSDQKKRLSIPRTVSRVLKYIPELQKEVETLRSKKEKLLSYSSSTANTRNGHPSTRKQSAEDTIIKTQSFVVSSVSVLGDKEVVIQLISSEDHMTNNKKINNLLSKVLEYLEQEENELVLINATTFKSSGEGMLLITLHLETHGDHKIEAETLKEKLSTFHQ